MTSAQKQFQPFVMAEERAARSVFVGNIPYEATEEQLKEIFNQVGPVSSFRLVYDRETGKPKGYGFCEYQDLETAQSAMRNLNNHDFNGRPLRVGVAAGENTKEENRLLNGPPVESPYGEPVEPEKAPEAVARAVASLPPEQMFELMKQMKMCILNNPNEARNMLLQNPQLAYALLQAQIVMKIVDPQVALAMLHRQTEQIPPMMQTPAQQQQQQPPMATAVGGPMSGGAAPLLGPGPGLSQSMGTPPMDARPGFAGPSRPAGPAGLPGMLRPGGPEFGPRGPVVGGPRSGLLGDMPLHDVDHRDMVGPGPGGMLMERSGQMDPHDMDRRDMRGPMDVDHRDLGPMGPMDRRDMGPGPMDRRDAGPGFMDRRDMGPGPMDRRDMGPMDRLGPGDRRDFGPPRDMGPMDVDRRGDFGPPMDRRDMGGPMDRRDMGGPMDRSRDMGGPIGSRPPMGMMGERGPRGEMMGMGPGPRFSEPDMGPGPRPGMGQRPGMGGPGPRPDIGSRMGMGGPPGAGTGQPRGPVPDIRDPRQAADLRRALGQPSGPRQPGPSMGGSSSGATHQDQEKAALIMQVLQLSDDQIAMLPSDQRESILILKEQIARSATS